MKKSVVIIGTRGYPSYYGGFETLVRNLAPFLSARGWEVTVYGREGATEDHDSGRDPSVRTVLTRGIDSKSLSTLSYGLTSSIHAAVTRPDVALVMNVANGYWLPILKSRRIPTVVNVDGIEWDRAKWGKKARTAFKLGAHLTAKFGDRIVVDSHEIERRWWEDFHRSGDFIPYGGSDPGPLQSVDGLTPGGYALMVARFVEENTVEAFFEAAEDISTDWEVVIVGSSGYGGKLDLRAEQLSKNSPRIHWMGHISDDQKLFSLWQNSGAYFHGHSVGGTNPALVQAMACGAPIVARDTVFNREVLGDSGRFVSPTPSAITASIRSLLGDNDRQAELRRSARDRQAAEYTWDIVCKAYETSLLDALFSTL
ncbi:glycosyltransferase [Rhodococcus coprophilus]|uniref:Glycosyltransferase n=1 Tax=Rhodococcus coprophilus TaxID=38310 RepID=A0A2X4UBZ4_9NOCA|nr:glycosyltransferase [Rhodococcus coprophilus]MBM7459459.1 glycosyltransferase involved in cell wall biosynthesis [Rhodococcus coprophilus]SQI36129.1 glycosyltransferase [Rhodococcus coprophilus]